MITTLFYRHPRLLFLVLMLIIVAGLSAFRVLPRGEDPAFQPRFGRIFTALPGAESERIEALVTDPIEDQLLAIEEIKHTYSQSRTGLSVIVFEFKDELDGQDLVRAMTRVRDEVGDVVVKLPPGATTPEIDDSAIKAVASVAAIIWKRDTPPPMGLLRRTAEELEDRIRHVSGTEETEEFGMPIEEVHVDVDSQHLADLGLTVEEISHAIRQADSKASAGIVHGVHHQIHLKVRGEIETLERVRSLPIVLDERYGSLTLGDLGTVRKTVKDPPDSLAFVDRQPAIAIGARLSNGQRIDHWSERVRDTVSEFDATLGPDVEARVIFEQNFYVERRLSELMKNFLLGAIAVSIVVFILMGWRAAIAVTVALPLTSLMVLSGLQFMGVDIQQMSVTGLVIALGLLIDNAIVMVDEVRKRLGRGETMVRAIDRSIRLLAIPLFGSTLTTSLAFLPLALMPGPAGDFVGSIAISVILALSSSLILSMTLLPAITGWTSSLFGGRTKGFLENGLSIAALRTLYDKTLVFALRHPIVGILIGLALPMSGFLLFGSLKEQFFPPSDRNQCHIQVELPHLASLDTTVDLTEEIEDVIRKYEEIESVFWTVGEAAPMFFYNVMFNRDATPSFAHAMVHMKLDVEPSTLIREIQTRLDERFPQARILVRQLDLGPPVNAPIELRVFGPDLDELQRLGDSVRAQLVRIPEVIHTRSQLDNFKPTLWIEGSDQDLRLAGFDNRFLAQQLEAKLVGSRGGTLVEATEELDVRTRLNPKDTETVTSIASLGLDRPGDLQSTPLTALADLSLKPEYSVIQHRDGRRMNRVQAFLVAATLPSQVQKQVEKKIEEGEIQLPDGYRFEFGGESSERNNAIDNLMAFVPVLLVMMAATLVLTFNSFRIAAIIGMVGALSVGLALMALRVFDYPFGFTAIIGAMGLVGVAINDSIVVLASIRHREESRRGEIPAMRDAVFDTTRHVVATTLTTTAGFAPLFLAGGGFWPPLAIAIAGGVSGATLLALFLVPSTYRLLRIGRVREATTS